MHLVLVAVATELATNFRTLKLPAVTATTNTTTLITTTKIAAAATATRATATATTFPAHLAV